MKDCCIIIPIYNTIPTESEIFSISRAFEIFSEQYDIYFIHAEGLNKEAYHSYGSSRFISFPDKYFCSNKTYSRLLLSKNFYISFMQYRYMLITQSDTYVLNTNYRLSDFISKDYDYWGAPWPNGPFQKPYGIKDYFKLPFLFHPENCHVGNGGFSLRKVSSTQLLVSRHTWFLRLLWHFNEDLFFSVSALKHPDKYKAAPVKEAAAFALECNMKEEIASGHIPFAVHAWEKHGLDMASIASIAI